MDADVVDELNAVGVKEILDQDSRPTFVLDLDPDDGSPWTRHAILPVFCNLALRQHERLFDGIIGTQAEGLPGAQDEKTYQEFKDWATGVTKFDESKDVFPLTFLYGEMLWTGSTVRKRWRLISGNLLREPDVSLGDLSSVTPSKQDSIGALRIKPVDRHIMIQQPKPLTTVLEDNSTETSTLVSSKLQQTLKPFHFTKSSEGSSEGVTVEKTLTLSAPEAAVTDWTIAEPKGKLSAHVQFARTVHWASTPLGPMESWSPEFRQVTNLLMGNPHPAALFWGSELTMIYNEAYATEVAGNKHPSLMGTGFSGPFAELWDAVKPVFDECARTGVSVRRENDYLPIERRGFVEETFYSWSFTPLYGGTDRILGFYNAPFETTQQVLSQRRTQVINKLGACVISAKTVKGFWKYVLDGLEDNHFDVPFALLYSVGDGEDGDYSSMSSGSTISLKSCFLEGTIGIPDGHVAAPQQLDLKRSREGFIPSFREAMRTREPTLLHTRDGTLPEDLLDGIKWRGFEEPCHQAIIFPVRPTNGDMILAFLLIGVNPRRPYDSEYRAFTNVLNRTLATSLASVMLFEEEVRRSRDAAEAAALEQAQLAQQLAVQTNRLRRMTELSPLGMFLINPDGVLKEANDRYFEMTGLSKDYTNEMTWMDCITEDSKETMRRGWRQMMVEQLPWSGELRLKKLSVRPVDLGGESIDYWIMSTAQPEFAPDGSLRSIMGSITDISHLKWAQGLQDRRLQEAEETRRQQNEFIDITSHEMRNPLSAILQCADDILFALRDHRTKNTPPSPEIVESCLDSANTIALCVQHQKSIVDDILTISKLDSNLLTIAPVTVQPVAIARHAVKMFDPEVKAKDINVDFDVAESILDLEVDWMNLDPSRLLQIIINLMTNAIKFTAGEDKRMITVSLGAYPSPPVTQNDTDFEYIPAKASITDFAASEDWGSGELLYLRCTVQDTGCGLTRAEKQVLFERFSQASPRTHAQYGGSGLGLFISRQLAELHGGQIGVASEAGLGSTFGFFIAARRANPPAHVAVPESLATENLAVANTPVTPPVAHFFQELASPGLSSGASIFGGGSGFDPKTLHILVVEDNLINQKVLVKQLKKVGSAVDVANDGIEALAFLEQTVYRVAEGHPLSVILMDLEMPNMDGLTCVRMIRTMEKEGKLKGHVPVIACTANVREQQIEEAKRCGMDDYILKPFQVPDLYKKIQSLLSRQ